MHDYVLSLAGFAGIWLAAVISPGPNFIMVTRASLGCSREAGIRVALGVAVGAAIWAIATLLGLQALFKLFPWLLDAARIIGGVYILYLGLKTLLSVANHKNETPTSTQALRTPPFRQGLYTSFSNPKTAVFFGSMFSALLPHGAPVWLYAVAIIMLTGISICWYGGVACIFSLPGARRIYLRWQRLLDAITGGLLTLVGVRFISSR